ncbi:MAG: phenylalanine--tRNA ligase subunit beta [Saprospiraceae bacterium]|nr:phenylalanine--tRNA ligase subunit beta [Saprospiraceae bacterium]
MKLSLRWVKQYITLEYGPEEIAEMLTTIGLEVEGWEKIESVKGGLAGVVVGHVLTCEKHPDADKLSLTTVNVGEENPLQIVCGAPNVAAGQKVLVATIGTTLYDKEDQPWKIKKGKIRGAESEGMICALDELGLGEDHSGIMILDPDAVPGTSAKEYLKLQEDIVFEIGLTPNRSDATSHLGVARDLYAYLTVNKNYNGKIHLPDTSDFVTEKVRKNIKVEVLHKEACPRYAGITIEGVTIGESPDLIKQYLLAIGVKPINNIVDITNYVLHETGQPLHAFDADKIKENKILVDCLEEGTPFVALDGSEKKLSGSDLMICDGTRNPMCMAGVYGGLESGVSKETVNIFLESAYFHPKYVRNSSTKHILRTDAAKIFEKGADPNMVITALKRAAGLIRKYANGSVSSELVDIYPKPMEGHDIKLRYQKVNDVIGIHISKEKIHQILSGMDMKIKPLDEGSILVNPGTNKHDVIREIDLIEEILRIYGLNNIPFHDDIKSTISYSDKPNKNEIKEIIANYLSANKFHEMMGLSLMESKQIEHFSGTNPETFVFINNTSNVHLDIMRPDMMLSGLLSVAYNLNRQQNNIKLFEHGKSYQKSNDGFLENECISLFLSGKKQEETWISDDKKEVSFYDVKHAAVSVLKRLGIKSWQEDEVEESSGLNYGLVYHRGGNPLVYFGMISKNISKKAGIRQDVYYARFDLINIVASLHNVRTTVKEISKFPSTRRDLAIIVDQKVAFKEIVGLSAKVDKKILQEVRLFDVFKDPVKVGENKKSYAVSFHFENTEKTMSDQEIDGIMQKIISALENNLGANIRK